MLADGQPLVIQELEGSLRVVELSGAEILRGLETEGKLRTQTTYYPGTNAPSVQVLGTEDAPLTFKGELRDVLSERAGRAAEVRGLLMSIFRSQRPVEVSWGSLVVVRGLLSRPKFSFERESIIQYTMEVLVLETDEPEVLSSEFPAVENDRDLLDALREALAWISMVEGQVVALNNLGKALT